MTERFIVLKDCKWKQGHVIVCDNFGNDKGVYLSNPDLYRELKWYEHADWPLRVKRKRDGRESTATGFLPNAPNNFGLLLNGKTYPFNPEDFEPI